MTCQLVINKSLMLTLTGQLAPRCTQVCIYRRLIVREVLSYKLLFSPLFFSFLHSAGAGRAQPPGGFLPLSSRELTQAELAGDFKARDAQREAEKGALRLRLEGLHLLLDDQGHQAGRADQERVSAGHLRLRLDDGDAGGAAHPQH